MPKRSAEERIERYQRKIQKLMDSSANNEKRRRRVRVISGDSSEVNEDIEATRPEIIITNAEVHGPSSLNEAGTPEEAVSETIAVSGAESSLDLMVGVPESNETEQSLEVPTPELELDPELLEALGEPIDNTPEYGPKIHENLAKLWLPLLKKGMPKENKDKILKEYLVPENCQLLQAPKLNAEISAAVPDVVRNRDKGLVAHQQQLGFGITSINRALDLLLKGDNKKEAIYHLSNSCRILSDLHAISTQSRIKLITPSLDKSFLHVIQDSERDETLFGNKLSEKIKAAKAIERQGLQIKKATNSKASSSAQTSANRASSSGNWTGPPRYSTNRGRGGYRRNQGRRPYQSGASASRPSTQTTQSTSTQSKPRAQPTQ